MLSNSKSKDGSLKNVHAEHAKYILGSRVYNNIKKLVFIEIKLYVITIIIAIDYCVLSFIKCKLNLISFSENNCQC